MKKLINLCVMLLAFGFYTTSNCYYPIAAHTALKVYLKNNTPYSISLVYLKGGSPLDKKNWQEGDDTIKPWSSENELIFWKKFGSVKSTDTHTFTITAVVRSTPQYQFNFTIEYKGNNLSFRFPSKKNPINAVDFRIDKVPKYVLGTVENKKLVLSINKSQSYGTGVNRYGVIVFDLDLE